MGLLDTWTLGEHSFGGVTHPTYRKGSGPGVVIIHEIPGLTPEVIGFAEEVGGSGGDLLDSVAMQEAMFDAGASSGLMAGLFTAGIALPHIAASGNADLVDRFVRPTLAGDLIGSLAITW